MDTQKLTSIGLGKSEAEIYLALLRTGKATATTLTKKTGIHRTYIYDILEKLKEKGLVSYIKEHNKQYFYPLSPERLKEYLLEKVEIVEDILPELAQLKKTEETNVQVYKGKEGIKAIMNDILKTNKEYYVVGASSYFQKVLPIFTTQYMKRLTKQKLKEKIILEKGEETVKDKKGEYRFLPKEYIFLSSMVIYGDKVALFVWKEPYLQVLIQNKDIATSYHAQFDILWRMAKK